MPERELRVGGLARLSTCDWPGELAATVFCQGCGWDCVYCHNPHLIPAHSDDLIAWYVVRAFLEERRGLLDGIVFSGGEPTLQAALPGAIAETRELGFQVALHTNGQLPERLAEVLPLLDWVGFDVKAPLSVPDSYDRVTGVAGSGERTARSLNALVSGNVPYEVRTTVHSALLSEADLRALSEDLREAGVRRWVVQSYRREGVRGDRLGLSAPLSPELLGELSEGFEEFEFRG